MIKLNAKLSGQEKMIQHVNQKKIVLAWSTIVDEKFFNGLVSTGKIKTSVTRISFDNGKIRDYLESLDEVIDLINNANNQNG